MMNKKKIILCVCAALLLISLIAAGVWRRLNKDVISVSRKDEFSDFLHVEQGAADPKMSCIVTSQDNWNLANQVIPGKFIYLKDMEFKRERAYVKSYDSAKLTVHDFSSQEKYKTIDVKELVEKEAPDKIWNAHVGTFINKNGEAYFDFLLEDPKDPYDSEKKQVLYVNISTDESMLLEKGEKSEKINPLVTKADEMYKNMNGIEALFSKDEIGLLEQNGFSYFNENDKLDMGEIWVYPEKPFGSIGVQLAKATLPKENNKLYGEFPRLKDYEGKENDIVTLYLAGNSSPEDILSLLTEAGKEVTYDRCVLSAENSIDGQEHAIHSFDEYLQWKEFK